MPNKGIRMPLSHGKSKASFEKNVKTEIKAGKKPSQAVAIAYSAKKESSKHPKGCKCGKCK